MTNTGEGRETEMPGQATARTRTNGNGTGPVAPYHDKAAWLEEHRTGIGGSDAAAVVGLDPWRGPWDVWDAKNGLGDPVLESGDIRRGTKQEPIAREKLAEEAGIQIRRQPMRRHPERPWMLCDVDGQVVNHDRGPGLVEIKVPRVPKFFQIREEGIPAENVIQVHHNMLVWGYTWSIFAIYTPEYDELVHFEVDLDEELAAWLVAREESFYRDYLVPGVRPRPEDLGPADPPSLPSIPGQAELRTDEKWMELAERYAKAEKDLEWAKGEYDAAKAALIEDAGDPEDALYVTGHGVTLKRSWCAGRRTLDEKALAGAKPVDRTKLLEFVASMEPADQGIFTLHDALREDEMTIDLDEFRKVGKPYARTTVNVVAPEEAFDR